MINMFTDVRILIWDFDGTFYKPNSELYRAIREAEYRTIMNHTGWSHEKTEQEFTVLYRTRFDSATETTAHLSGISIAQSAVEMEDFFDRREYLKRDSRLITLFRKLKKYRHFILANGVIAKHRETLKVLGLPAETFEEIVTSETVGKTKPDPAGFRYILGKTRLPPEEHLMIGDREMIDLVPAKALGMKTVLVWADVKSRVADMTLPDVYHVEKILI